MSKGKKDQLLLVDHLLQLTAQITVHPYTKAVGQVAITATMTQDSIQTNLIRVSVS